jgi:hypothetical protein
MGVGGRGTKHLGKTIYRQPYVEDDCAGNMHIGKTISVQPIDNGGAQGLNNKVYKRTSIR